jgi:hypothetical protein
MLKIAKTLSDLQYQIEQRDNLKSNISLAESRVREAKTRLDELNQTIIEGMAKNNVTNFGTDKYRVTIAHRAKIEINDQVAFRGWLSTIYEPEDYMTLDTTRSKRLAEHAMRDDGEIIPGIEPIMTEFLTVTPRKGETD